MMNRREQLLYDYCYEEKHSEGKEVVDDLFARLLDIMEEQE